MATHTSGFEPEYATEKENYARIAAANDKKDDILGQTNSLDKKSSGSFGNEKHGEVSETAPPYEGETVEERFHVDTAADLVTNILHVDDDPSLNPWTFRMWFLGEKYQSSLSNHQSNK